MTATPQAEARMTAQFLQALAACLPAEGLVLDEAGRRAYECDALTLFRRLPGVVAIPEEIAQVQAILRLCDDYGVPVVARGAGTGLSGGALPHAEGVLLNLSRLDATLEIDPDRRLARVGAGVRNLAISQAAAPHGLYFAPDPSSQVASTLGGNIAENAGGVHCLKYGLTVNNVVAATLITIDGERLTLGSPLGEAPGLDLLALIHGSEGLLGVVVEAWVELLPLPRDKRVLLAGFAEVTDCAEAVAAIIAAGVVPAGLELMDRAAVVAVEAMVQQGWPCDLGALLICELDGSAAEVTAQSERVTALLKTHGADHLESATDPAEQARIWSVRKAAFPAIARLAPDTLVMDGSVPRRRLAAVLTRIIALAEAYGLRVFNTFHAGDGNIHPVILFDSRLEGELERAESLGQAILRLCVEEGGSITGEHGVGAEKVDAMCDQFSAAELRQFEAIKAAFDPRGLLNPGKLIPTLNRCAELGHLHVKDGRFPHPELPRF
ncbi:FAD-linked oxidase C-terminal domain-containing protein [Halomonas pacifica]|uniref:Glycolate oxidase subunit GlcD n=1 Tax=Bisbaumannia pacifica TaxID=77098 RepID=A0A510X8F4_9GAMM|nr:FAD-linked oxidase C-terminal domain-containing protein [Halomonas pacifica]MDC8805406.1 FAD-linked oxidase C-terminal domain-containing protein [Halomonas pacifica]GEK47728.1 glycolate oxidase subunit GlcD [Halomonas pacifica]